MLVAAIDPNNSVSISKDDLEQLLVSKDKGFEHKIIVVDNNKWRALSFEKQYAILRALPAYSAKKCEPRFKHYSYTYGALFQLFLIDEIFNRVHSDPNEFKCLALALIDWLLKDVDFYKCINRFTVEHNLYLSKFVMVSVLQTINAQQLSAASATNISALIRLRKLFNIASNSFETELTSAFKLILTDTNYAPHARVLRIKAIFDHLNSYWWFNGYEKMLCKRLLSELFEQSELQPQILEAMQTYGMPLPARSSYHEEETCCWLPRFTSSAVAPQSAQQIEAARPVVLATAVVFEPKPTV